MTIITRYRKNIKRIEKELRALGVQTVYVFGSRAEEVSTFLSDLDIGIIMKSGIDSSKSMNIYVKLYDLLTEVFGEKNHHGMDIVFLQKAPLELQFDVIKHGIVLFDTAREEREAYEHNTEMKYIDFRPLLNEFNRKVIQRL